MNTLLLDKLINEYEEVSNANEQELEILYEKKKKAKEDGDTNYILNIQNQIERISPQVGLTNKIYQELCQLRDSKQLDLVIIHDTNLIGRTGFKVTLNGNLICRVNKARMSHLRKLYSFTDETLKKGIIMYLYEGAMVNESDSSLYNITEKVA